MSNASLTPCEAWTLALPTGYSGNRDAPLLDAYYYSDPVSE